MAILQLPARNDTPAYKFQVTLETRIFTLSFRYNTRMSLWVLDLADEKQDPIFMGVPLLLGDFLFSDFVDPRAPQGDFFLIDETGQNKNPTRESLGVDVKLIYVESSGLDG